MRIGKPVISFQDDNINYRVLITSGSENNQLWFSMNKKFQNLISDTSDSALTAMLIPAMLTGEDIYIDGSISEKLFFNYSRQYQHILKSIFPNLHVVKIYPAILHSVNRNASGIATAITGGVDSYCVLADHHYVSDTPASYKLTHLLFNNVGSHGAGGEKLFLERLSRVKPVAKRIGLPLISVNSNLDHFYYHCGLTQSDTHTHKDMAIAHLLQNGIGRYLYASTYPVSATIIGVDTGGIDRCDSIVLPLLSTESVEIISACGEYTRVEKTLRIAEITDTHNSLEVCIKARAAKKVGALNCSHCQKCMRTMLTLEIAGLLDLYKSQFNMKVYRKHRNRFISESILIKKHGVTDMVNDIYDFAEMKKFRIPLSVRFSAKTRLVKLYPFFDLLKRVLRKFRRIAS